MPVNISGSVVLMLAETSGNSLPNGPYVVETVSGDVFPVFRLFDDTHDAFIGGSVKPSIGDRPFEWLKIEVCGINRM